MKSASDWPTMKLSGFGSSQRAPLNTFGNALFTGYTWPSGITRLDSRNCYFIFVNVGTKEGFHHFIASGSGGLLQEGVLWARTVFISPYRKASSKRSIWVRRWAGPLLY